MNKGKIIVQLLLLILVSMGCNDFSTNTPTPDKNDKKLAQIEDKVLYLSEIKEMMAGRDSLDSLQLQDALVESWLKRTVLLLEAEKQMPVDINLEKLVNDYRNSLILNNYQQELIKNKLDTITTDRQIEDYYAANKSQYLLNEPILQIAFAKVKDDAPGIERFYKNWQKENSDEVEDYLEQNGSYSILKDTTWYTLSKVKSYLPENLWSKSDLLKEGAKQKHKGEFEYFLRTIKSIDQKEEPPLSYIKHNIRRVLLHERKNEILNTLEGNLYKTYLNANKIKVYKK